MPSIPPLNLPWLRIVFGLTSGSHCRWVPLHQWRLHTLGMQSHTSEPGRQFRTQSKVSDSWKLPMTAHKWKAPLGKPGKSFDDNISPADSLHSRICQYWSHESPQGICRALDMWCMGWQRAGQVSCMEELYLTILA
jgi:hypothetical protein